MKDVLTINDLRRLYNNYLDDAEHQLLDNLQETVSHLHRMNRNSGLKPSPDFCSFDEYSKLLKEICDNSSYEEETENKVHNYLVAWATYKDIVCDVFVENRPNSLTNKRLYDDFVLIDQDDFLEVYLYNLGSPEQQEDLTNTFDQILFAPIYTGELDVKRYIEDPSLKIFSEREVDNLISNHSGFAKYLEDHTVGKSGFQNPDQDVLHLNNYNNVDSLGQKLFVLNVKTVIESTPDLKKINPHYQMLADYATDFIRDSDGTFENSYAVHHNIKDLEEDNWKEIIDECALYNDIHVDLDCTPVNIDKLPNGCVYTLDGMNGEKYVKVDRHQSVHR